MKDVRSFSFKLVPVIDNKESISRLQDHKLLKSQQDETFKSSHAHEYIGQKPCQPIRITQDNFIDFSLLNQLAQFFQA